MAAISAFCVTQPSQIFSLFFRNQIQCIAHQLHNSQALLNLRLSYYSQNASQMITSAKEKYFLKLGQKLSDPANGVKAYWSTLNKIINRNKVTNIPPLLENGVLPNKRGRL